MLMTWMILCALAAVILILAGVYSDFHERWAHPDHRAVGGGSQFTDKHPSHR